MKKSILSVFAGLFIITTLFAQDAKEENHAGVKYTTHITSVITYPWGVQLNVTEAVKVPFLNFNNPFMRGNNVTFKFGAEVTPITLEGKFDIVWTPLAFLELYGGASIGSGWSIKRLHGLAFNTNESGRSVAAPINFKKAFYTLNFGGALQFDLGAIVPSDWAHVVFRIDQYFFYRGVTGANSFDSWIFQNDEGKNRNGFIYCGTYLLGYQMPIPLNLIALRVETQKSFYKAPEGRNKSDWGEDRYSVVFGPVLSFKVTDRLTILLIAQLKTIHQYQSSGSISQFYQTRYIDKSKADKIAFKRVGVIFNITIPNN